MRKIILGVVIITFMLVVGYWIPIPLSEAQTISAVTLIFDNGDAIIDYNKDYGFLVSLKDSGYLRDVKSIKWQVVERGDLEKFMDDNKIDKVFHGYIHIGRKRFITEISIGNQPVASKCFKGIFLCGGARNYTAYKRFPSILNFFYGDIVIKEECGFIS